MNLFLKKQNFYNQDLGCCAVRVTPIPEALAAVAVLVDLATANPQLEVADKLPEQEQESWDRTLPSEEGVTVVSQVQAGQNIVNATSNGEVNL